MNLPVQNLVPKNIRGEITKYLKEYDDEELNKYGLFNYATKKSKNIQLKTKK